MTERTIWDSNQTTPGTAEENDIRHLEKLFVTYKIGEALDKSYFLILTPIGLVGNILSFLVMIQPQNRQMSFSWYISALAVSDTIALLVGFFAYLRQVHYVSMPPNPLWNCRLANTAVFMSMMWSTLFIICMTFERFYSIVRPHKAASFNTVKRAKVTILSCVLFGFLFNLHHLFFSRVEYLRCIPHSVNFRHVEIYYWLSFVLSYALPFISLLTMNIVIIHTLRTRSNKNLTKYEGQGQGQGYKIKNTERQIYITLILVTFGFLVFTTPVYLVKLLVYASAFSYGKTLRSYALYYMLFHLAQKAFYTNNGINFFFYVMSGQKFRTDLLKLFHCYKDGASDKFASVTSNTHA